MAQLVNTLQNELQNRNRTIDDLKQGAQNKQMEIDKLNKDIQNQQNQYETLKMTIKNDKNDQAMNLTKIELDEIETAVRNLQNGIEKLESRLIENELEAIEDICNTFEKQQISLGKPLKPKREPWDMYKNVKKNIRRKAYIEEKQDLDEKPIRTGQDMEIFGTNENDLLDDRAESKEIDDVNSQPVWQFGDSSFGNNFNDKINNKNVNENVHGGFERNQQRGSTQYQRKPKRPEHQPPRTRN